MSQHQTINGNHLLGSMGRDVFGHLTPYLEPLSLHVRDVLVEPNVPIEHVYFLDGGLSSIVLEGEDGKQAEVGMTGREGLVGFPVLLAMDRTPHKTFMQVAGPARRIRVAALQAVMRSSPALQGHLLQAVFRLMLQISETARMNARGNLNQRLARWLLMASDRLGTEDVPLTHEFLSLMLGVRRAGVTETMHILEGIHAIRAKRGQVTIRDRTALEMIAGESYDTSVSIASANGITPTKRPLSS